MLTKFVVAFAILALVAAIAGTVPAKGPTYHVTLSEPSVVSGTALKAGDYKVTVNTGKVTFTINKETHEVSVKVETDEKKFSQNAVQYERTGNQNTIKEICLGGSKTRLVFN